MNDRATFTRMDQSTAQDWPSASSNAAAAVATCTSEPVEMMIAFGAVAGSWRM